MKYIFLTLSFLISGASFAQNLDFILTESYGNGDKQPPIFARISISKRVYDLTNANPKIELVCKYSKDKDLQMGLSKGEIYSTHKKFNNGKANHPCPSGSCYPKKFEDLSDHRQFAVSSPSLVGEIVTNYSIQSTDSWNKRRDMYVYVGIDNWKYAELDNIETLEIYSPSKHKRTMPTVNGFSCTFLDHENRKILEP